MSKAHLPEKVVAISSPFTGEEEWQALLEPLMQGWLTQGPKVAAFEQTFAQRHHIQYAIATTSCTTALHLAVLAIGLKPGDTVLVPSFTWIATANVVEYCGGVPVFVDSNPATYNIDPQDLKAKLDLCIANRKTPKAIIAVHLFGLCADMDPILDIARQYNIKVIEDAACAVGSMYKERHAGSIGDIGCFSFHPRKIITTGEGGMCTTNSKEYAELMSCLRNHGASLSEEQRHNSNKPYLMADFNQLGFNYRMTDLQGAVGLVQLSKLDRLIQERRKWAEYYQRELASIDWLTVPFVPENCYHSWQAYVCRVDQNQLGKKRNEVMEYLYNKGISTRPGTHAIHRLEYYAKKYNVRPETLSIASQLYNTTIALPLHNRMNQDDYQRVIDVIREI